MLFSISEFTFFCISMLFISNLPYFKHIDKHALSFFSNFLLFLLCLLSPARTWSEEKRFLMRQRNMHYAKDFIFVIILLVESSANFKKNHNINKMKIIFWQKHDISLKVWILKVGNREIVWVKEIDFFLNDSMESCP